MMRRASQRFARHHASRAVACIVLGAAGAANAETVSYQLDPTHSFVFFEIDHFATSTIRGRLGPVNGEVEVDRSARVGRVQVRIPTASVSLGFPAFDSRVRAADLLATEQFKLAYFVAEKFALDGAGPRSVSGELTLRDTSRPVELRALRFNCYTNPLFRREVCGGDFEARLLRSEFGMTFGLPFVGDRVRLLIQVEAVRAGSEPAQTQPNGADAADRKPQ
jgi:polyisoprenoid-binding protein YceI